MSHRLAGHRSPISRVATTIRGADRPTAPTATGRRPRRSPATGQPGSPAPPESRPGAIAASAFLQQVGKGFPAAFGIGAEPHLADGAIAPVVLNRNDEIDDVAELLRHGPVFHGLAGFAGLDQVEQPPRTFRCIAAV